jgi:hypothetical protein
MMDPRDELGPEQLNPLNDAFRNQLMACLEECAHGRQGLFSDLKYVGDEEGHNWPEAAQLRKLALGLQGILTQQNQRNALCDEFLDLCSIHGEYNPGERRLARTFLDRIEKGEVGTKLEEERKPW